MRRLIPSACLLALLAGSAGCGSKKVSVSGTVTRGGEKMTWPDGGNLLVIFIPEDRERDTHVYSARTDTETSTYTIDGIPTGKYVVAVQQFDARFMDALGGKYDPGHTEMKYEVTQNGQVIDIDVPAPPKREPRGKKKDDDKEKGAEKEKKD